MNIRNFCIIAHIDHGKSTLADRFLELTGTVEKRKMHEQYLDTMDLERERGITIKLQAVRMQYKLTTNNLQPTTTEYQLNLIDTPGHVDFTYEVSRSLAAVEGTILLVDATKGVQAQTLANLHLAQAQKLVLVPVINKIDLPNARTEQVKEELSYLLGVEPGDILEISAKSGLGVEAVLKRVIEKVPPPGQETVNNEQGTEILKALIFDSTFDVYKGVIAYVRIFSGVLKQGMPIGAFASSAKAEDLEKVNFSPGYVPAQSFASRDIGNVP